MTALAHVAQVLHLSITWNSLVRCSPMAILTSPICQDSHFNEEGQRAMPTHLLGEPLLRCFFCCLCVADMFVHVAQLVHV